ncbi:MAG: undecaprenyldiphospho-muramoylpentapeptide beta-N-acetylglucosaminyltransferase [Acidobacteriota bacterium]
MSSYDAAEQMLRRVLFAGGGTGGHVYMAIALRDALKGLGGETRFLFVGTREGLENQILNSADFPLRTIEIGGLKNVGVRRVLETLLQLPGSLVQSGRIVKAFSPDLTVGLGGYSSGPAVLAARWARVPSLIIEPNVVPGFTNRLLGKWVDAVAVAFPETAACFEKKARVTGIPVRREFHRIPPWSRKQGPLRVLVCGGSRGSHAINRLVCEALPFLDAERIQIHHQTGRQDLERVQAHYRECGFGSGVSAFIHDMADQFAHSDLVVSRAGALTIAEVTAAGRPAILIPFPGAADDHQTRNAQALVRSRAALMVREGASSGKHLAARILELEQDRVRLSKMARASRSLAQTGSTQKIVALMEDLAKGRP